MPQSFSVRLFDHWLEQNRACFRHPPTAIVRRKRSRAFRFAGVTLLIWGHVCDWRLRLPTVRGRRSKEVYPTRASLWIEHGFESLLDWSNAHFRPDLNMMLFQTNNGGATWVGLRRCADDMAVTAERGLVADYPLVG